MNFSKAIVSWYRKNKRELPWRKTKDPYKIWLSEIILQQTRVSQGLPYYKAFVKNFPTVHHLAGAEEGEILKTWQGLGYYSRARNLHFTAKLISKNFEGVFPSEYEEIKKLKGIGTYTAGAIASFAFNKPFPVVDGNVYRVLSRYLGIKTPIDSAKGKKVFEEKAALLLDKQNPGEHNQAIMEFGALLCVPKNPDCSRCPLRKNCAAFLNDAVEHLPVKEKKKEARVRHFNYLIFQKGGKFLIKKRTENDIWKNLYDFPLIETAREMNQQELQSFIGKSLPLDKEPVNMKHILSHQVILAKFWRIKKTAENNFKNSRYISVNQIPELAFPQLINKYITSNFK